MALEGVGVSVTPRPLFTPGKEPVPIVQEAGWAPWPVWTGAENLASTGIRSPDRPAHSQSLYRLRYLAHMKSGKVRQMYPAFYTKCKPDRQSQKLTNLMHKILFYKKFITYLCRWPSGAPDDTRCCIIQF